MEPLRTAKIHMGIWWAFTLISFLSFAICLACVSLLIRQPFETDWWDWLSIPIPPSKGLIGQREEIQLFSHKRFFSVQFKWFYFASSPHGELLFRPYTSESGLTHRITAPKYGELPYVQPPGWGVANHFVSAERLFDGFAAQSTFQAYTSFSNGGYPLGSVSRLLIQLPAVPTTEASGVLPLVWYSAFIIRRHRRRAVVRGACARCGYDLRASPDQCPECGTRLPVAARTRL